MDPLPQGKKQIKFLLVVLFYEVGGSRGFGNNRGGKSTKLCMEEHCL